MAKSYFHIAGCTPVAGQELTSTELPRTGFKLAIPNVAADAYVIVFDKRFWSAKNTGKRSAGGAAGEDVFYRAGTTAPTDSYAADSAAKRASLPIEDGQDELLQVQKGDGNSDAKTFVADTAGGGEVVVAFRPNAAEYK